MSTQPSTYGRLDGCSLWSVAERVYIPFPGDESASRLQSGALLKKYTRKL
jgi:hypothetical protein